MGQTVRFGSVVTLLALGLDRSPEPRDYEPSMVLRRLTTLPLCFDAR